MIIEEHFDIIILWILRNNIDERTAHRNKASHEALDKALNTEIFELMPELERARMQIILHLPKVNV